MRYNFDIDIIFKKPQKTAKNAHCAQKFEKGVCQVYETSSHKIVYFRNKKTVKLNKY